MSLAVLLVARVLLISGLTAYLWSWVPRKTVQVAEFLRHPPGPKPWPAVGNLIFFFKLSRNTDYQLTQLAKEYGGICMLWLSSTPVMIISKAEDAKKLLDKKGSIYSDRPSQDSFRGKAWPWRLATTGVGPRFRFLRRVYHNLLGQQQAAGFRKYQDHEAKVMLGDLIKAPEEFLAHGERFATSVIFSAVYGVRLAQLDHPIMAEFYALWEEMLESFQPGTLLVDYFPVLEKLPEWCQPWIHHARRLREQESVLHRAFLKKLKTQVQGQNNPPPTCFGTDLVHLQETENITDEQAISILAMIIGAGAETTSSMIQSFFKVMAMNPTAQRKAQEELDRVVGPSRLPTWEDEAKLPYLRALIKEVHRWAPIASLLVPHATSDEDTTDQGWRIPKGTVVFPNVTAIHKDPDVYSDPEKFAPERFLGHDLSAVASAKHPDFRQRDHCHYGFGRRLCQGIFVAEASLFIVVSRVLWAFEISPDPSQLPLDLGDKVAGLVTRPKPYKVRIVPRSACVVRVVQDTVDASKSDILDFDSVDVLGN
ncbi:cytochrome P450 [Apodospora peruviana]|uniref:Cytochrome P450 n=1 Tax=Apodospora peruviana TaxID=516989 RepID=A0AAE0MGG6_9PEZI|nr:cytochrome P450 [Apodospora peruviana]